jgi:hypothetical protein
MNMVFSTEGVWIVTKQIDLIHSPDEGGFYFMKYGYTTGGKDLISQLYGSVADARKAYDNGAISWFEH